MRKIKITALILAVLMVMAAFAGCASKSTVEDLDDRVSALEEAINANQKANEEKITELATLIEALTKSQTDIKDSVDANKTAQDASNQAILDAIKDLTDKVTAVEKDQETTVKVDEALTALKQEKSKAIAAKKAVYEANRDDYTKKDYEAILTILSDADIAINAAATVAAANEIYAKMEADLAPLTAYDDQLYIYVTTLLGNISAETEDLVEEAVEYLEEALEHYDTETDAITEYVYGVDKDDNDMVINLVAAVTAINNLQNGTEASYTVVVNGQAMEFASLDYITTQAKKIDKDYKKLADKEATELISDNAAGALYTKYVVWNQLAAALGEKNVALVTTAADIAELAKMVENVADAKNAFAKLGKINYNTGSYADVLAPYTAWTNKTLIDDVVYGATKKNVYDVIDAKIEGWKDKFGFDDEFAAAVIASYYGDNSYDLYVADRDFVAHMEAAYATFVKDIVPQIKAVNATKTINASSVSAYLALEQAIKAWIVVVEDDKDTAKDETVKVNNANFALMLARQELALETVVGNYFDETTLAVTMNNIVAFANDDEDNTIKTFFDVTYGEAVTYAVALKKAFNTYNGLTSKETSILKALQLEGEWRLVAGINADYLAENQIETTDEEYIELSRYIGYYVEAADYDCFDYVTEEPYTIAGFEALYGDYGLMALLDSISNPGAKEKTLAQFKSYKKKVQTVIDDAVSSYADVVAAFNKIEYQAAFLDLTASATNKYKYSPVYIEGETYATPTYLVNLDDKATVEAAVAARNAWKLANRSGAMKDFVEATRWDAEAGKYVAIAGAYTLAPVANGTLDGILDDVAAKITTLSAQAELLINHFNQLADAIKTFEQNPVFNIISNSVLAAYDCPVVTGVTTYNDTDAIKHYRASGLYAGDKGLASYVGVLYDDVTNPAEHPELVTGDALAGMLAAGYTEYTNFCKASNDSNVISNVSYTETVEYDENGNEIRYLKMAAKTYAPVEEAKSALAAVDVAYAQARIIDELVAADIADTTKLNSYIALALAADTVAEYKALYDLVYNESNKTITLGNFKVYNDEVKVTALND